MKFGTVYVAHMSMKDGVSADEVEKILIINELE